MKIEHIEMRHVCMRLTSPFRTSVGVEHERHCLILCLSSEGLEGWGECVAGSSPAYSYETVGTAWQILIEFFFPILLANRKWNVPSFRQATHAIRGHPLARAGLEMALWDLDAKRKNVTLSGLLGGKKESVPVGVSIGIHSNISALLKTVTRYVDQGYQRVKLKVEPGKDLQIVRKAREEYPTLPLQIDANTAYMIDDAAKFEAMEEFDLQMIEQPFAEDDLLDHSKLQARIRTPICLDESIRTLRHAHQAIELDACRVVNIKQARVGGIWEALAIHEFCYRREVPVWCGGMLETGIGRAANLALASLPGFILPGDISATDRYFDEDIAEPRFELNPDSTIDVPCGAGLGVKIDKRALARVTLRTESFR